MNLRIVGKRWVGGLQDGQNRIALSDERDFERLLETALPLVRPIVRRIKRKLPRNFEVDELENIAMTGLFAAARDYRALHDGKFVGYAVTRILGAILDELRQTDWGLDLTGSPIDAPTHPAPQANRFRSQPQGKKGKVP